LLSQVAEVAAHRGSVISALEALLREPTLRDPVRRHLASLLGDLGGGGEAARVTRFELGGGVELSADDFASLLSAAPDIAQAADLLVSNVAVPEMFDLLDALCAQQPGRVIWLLNEILLRNDIDERCRRELKRLRAPLRDRHKPSARTRPPGLQSVATASLGRHANGRFVVIASRHIGHKNQRRHRAVCLFIAPDGTVSHGTYREDFPRGHVERELVASLRDQGYRWETVAVADAGYIVIRAAQTTRQLGRTIPREFYLGRDLLDIYDEHVTGLDSDDDRGALLDRAFELLTAEQPDRARPLFERFVAQAPNSPEGCAGMAMCLLALGDQRRARPHLRRALWLEPDNPNHHWNLSAIAHSQGRPGECYLQLLDYLTLCQGFDQAPGDASQRRVQAERFVSEYERIARVEFPGVDPIDVAQADELVCHARHHLHAHHYPEAIAVLEQAVSACPNHYPALAYLSIACAEGRRLDEAGDYLARATALRPGFAMVREARQRLTRLAAPAPGQPHARAPQPAKSSSPDSPPKSDAEEGHGLL
jgi:tetratricopeptide (TPR) repeat protein